MFRFYELKLNGKIYAAIGILVVVFIFAAVIRGSGDSSVKTNSKLYKIGEKIQAGSFSVQVKKTNQSSQLNGRKALHNLFIVQVSVKNTGMEPQTIESNLFRLISRDGKIYNSDEELSIAANNQGFIKKSLGPDLDETGYIVFEIPGNFDKNKYILEVYDNYQLGEKVSVSLGE